MRIKYLPLVLLSVLLMSCTPEVMGQGLRFDKPHDWNLVNISTAAEMLGLIRDRTMREGMELHAAYASRKETGALSDHPDYIALNDSTRMAGYQQAYWRIYTYFERADDRPLTEADWEMIGPLSDGDRLWYRVGALMASEIEADIGTEAYRILPRLGPDAFFGHYWQEAELEK